MEEHTLKNDLKVISGAFIINIIISLMAFGFLITLLSKLPTHLMLFICFLFFLVIITWILIMDRTITMTFNFQKFVEYYENYKKKGKQ